MKSWLKPGAARAYKIFTDHVAFFMVMLVLNSTSLTNKVFLQSLHLLNASSAYGIFVLYEALAYFSRLTIVLCIVLIVLHYMKNQRLQRIVQGLLIAICTGVSMADVFTLCQYQHGFDEAMLRVVLATNSREAGEFVHSYLGTILLSLAIIAIVLFLVIVAMRTFTIYKRLVLAGGAALLVTFVSASAVMQPVILQDKTALERFVSFAHVGCVKSFV